MRKWGKELDIVEIWTGGQTTESIQHISTVPSKEKVSCLTIQSLSSHSTIESLIDERLQSDLKAINYMVKEALVELCSQRENLRELIQQMKHFSEELSTHLMHVVTNESFNELVQGHNKNLNILADLAKTLKDSIPVSKGQINELSSEMEVIQKKKSGKKAKSFKQSSDDDLKIKLPAMISSVAKQKEQINKQNEAFGKFQKRISQLEINEQKKYFQVSEESNQQIKEQIQNLKRYIEVELEKYAQNQEQVNILNKKVDLLEENLDFIEKKIKEKQIEVKQYSDEAFEGLKISFQLLSSQMTKVLNFQADVSMKVDILTSDFDQMVSTQAKKMEDLEIIIKKSINSAIEQMDRKITQRFSSYQNNSNIFMKNMISSKKQDQAFSNDLLCQKSSMFLREKEENGQVFQKSQRLGKKLLVINKLKSDVDLSQILQISIEEFICFDGKKFKVFDRAFKTQECFEILYGSCFVILHNEKANLGIVIFYEEPDLTLYPRFSNDLLSDLIVIIFQKYQNCPFQVIHSNMSRTGVNCYTTDNKKFLYRQNEEPLKGNPQQDFQSICQDLFKLNRRKKMFVIRYQFSFFYESLNLEERLRLTEKNLDIYNFEISNFPVSFQILPKAQNFNKQLNNYQLKWFAENNSILHKKLSPHQSCRDEKKNLCANCNNLILNLHRELSERSEKYQQALGYLLQFFNSNGNSLGIWYHFSAHYLNKNLRLFPTKRSFFWGYALIFQGQILPNKRNWRYKLLEKYDELSTNLQISNDIITDIGALKIIQTIAFKNKQNSQKRFQIFLENGYLLSSRIDFIKKVKEEIQNIFGIFLRVISTEQSETMSASLLNEGYPLWLTKAKYIQTPKREIEQRFGIELSISDLECIRQNQIKWNLLEQYSKVKQQNSDEARRNPFCLKKYVIGLESENARSRSREKMKQNKKKYKQSRNEMSQLSQSSEEKRKKKLNKERKRYRILNENKYFRGDCQK